MMANMFVKDIFPVWLKSPINAGAFCMLAGFIIVPLVSMFTPAPDKAEVDKAFARYKKKVLVPQQEALGNAYEEFYF